MKFFDNILTWVKANVLLAVIILFVGVPLLFPRLLRGIIGPRRIRRRRPPIANYRWRSGSYSRARRSLPRSVGMHKIRRRPRKQYTRGGKAKKAWQIKGSVAARRHMARIRRMR